MVNHPIWTRRRPLVACAFAAALTLGSVPLGAAAAASSPLDAAPAQASPPGQMGKVGPWCGRGASQAQVEEVDGIWQATAYGESVYRGGSMQAAVQAGVDHLDEERTEQHRVVVRGDGTMAADEAIELDSHTSLEVCGTIHVEGNEDDFDYDDHTGVVTIRHAEDVSVPYLKVTGEPNFGVYLRTSSDVDFGQIDLRLDGGLGMRLDSRDDDAVREARNITIDQVYVSGTEAHGVETYGVDGLRIGNVTAVNTGYSGLLLNDTVNADIDSVVGYGAAAGTGYATFRTANQNGQVDGAYPTNIRVGEIQAHSGGRGIFCVSESGGLEVERLYISQTDNDAMLLENCHNLTLASQSGVIEGPGEIFIAAREEFDNNTDITLQNLQLRDSGVTEVICAENTVLENLRFIRSEADTCAAQEATR